MVDTILISCPSCINNITSDPTFIAGYDSLGNVFFAKGLTSGGDDEFALASGPSGALYFGGDYLSMSQPFIIGNDTFPPAGEVPFIAKLNIPFCSCNNPLAPDLTQSGDTLFVPQQYATYQWYHNSTPINGATNYFYVALVSGNYNIIVTDENGCDVGAGIINVVASIEPLSDKEQLIIYPNPTTNNFILKGVSSNKSFLLQITNPIGEIIYTEKFYSKKEYLIEASFAKGIYYVNIIEKERNVVKKLIVE